MPFLVDSTPPDRSGWPFSQPEEAVHEMQFSQSEDEMHEMRHLAQLINNFPGHGVFIAIDYKVRENSEGQAEMHELGISYLWRAEMNHVGIEGCMIPYTLHMSIDDIYPLEKQFLFGRTVSVGDTAMLRSQLMISLAVDSETTEPAHIVIVCQNGTQLWQDMRNLLNLDLYNNVNIQADISIDVLSRKAFGRSMTLAEVLSRFQSPFVYPALQAHDTGTVPSLPAIDNAGNGSHFIMLAMLAIAFHLKSTSIDWPPSPSTEDTSDAEEAIDVEETIDTRETTDVENLNIQGEVTGSHFVMLGIEWVVGAPMREYPGPELEPGDPLRRRCDDLGHFEYLLERRRRGSPMIYARGESVPFDTDMAESSSSDSGGDEDLSTVFFETL